MKEKKTMVLLVDRKKAMMFALLGHAVLSKDEFKDGNVPQKVKHGDDTWDAQNNIFRHIEDHLYRHLLMVGEHAEEFFIKNNLSQIVIGSHRSLFSKIEKNLPNEISRKVKARFIVDLKAPFNEILAKAEKTIKKIK